MQHVSSKNVKKNFPNIFTLGLTLWTSSFYVDLVEISIILMLRWWRERKVSFLDSNWWISLDKRVIFGFNVKLDVISINQFTFSIICSYILQWLSSSIYTIVLRFSIFILELGFSLTSIYQKYIRPSNSH